ncbi:DMT family transporter [Alicyclobacillus hesperidum]|uniref:DMT family transporter n=1 Tax=Alicyclobacillus hesperidum TaxID=89784 RepID=UPI00030D561F|nr:DMT family transporter [Alicyclobacillus hesperidum]
MTKTSSQATGASPGKLESLGLVYGLVGVLVFSLTLPASKVAVGSFGALVVGPGRALIAAIFAALTLWIRHEKLPQKKYLPGFIIIGVGAVFGFPLLTAWAMDRVPASHGAVELALLPIATAAVSALRNGERPSWLFWMCSVGGALTVAAYTSVTGLGGIRLADLALLGAVIIVAFAYAEGGRMASDLGGWQVIAWSVVISAPAVTMLLIIDFATTGVPHILHAPWTGWASLLYLGVGSQFFGFVAWYTGMGIGGVARVSQMQYLQPFFTILFSWVWLGERLTIKTLVAALVVVLWVAVGKRATVRRQGDSADDSTTGQPSHSTADLP